MIALDSMAFAGGGLVRAAHLRKDGALLSGMLSEGRVLPVWRGKPMVDAPRDALGWVRAGSPVLHGAAPPVFLGLDDAGKGLFAADTSDWSPEAGAEAVEAGFLDPSVQRHPALDDSHGYTELRAVMIRLSPLEAEIAATAKALLHWHRSHRYCAACGAPSDLAAGGWQRSCPTCAAQHFPRTDPVVIMLVTRGNRLLLGRSPGWPEGMYSTLAGFVEPGETVEAAVRREVFEETGIPVRAVRVLASQPWPFPASLMIGCHAEAEAEEIRLDPEELEDALWLSREDMAAVVAGRHPRVRAPRKGAIAHELVANWLADRLD
ncbi:NAD(+) diphosphatase [Aliigemmobacter aestuarii]|uniref:NAD(+) diphosphatase n=1 Tax=Aliigemmobacter aestuarii TaxID=1445661 RepID=A0A4V3V0D3_9RHOB|nr:NAD(+) diphosphatase [Gemmobacter aestuarii]THD83492.1 NAD(+) diphosphatase [Gemmobacter aestuarii]